MKEYIYVEFLITWTEKETLFEELDKLGDDFRWIGHKYRPTYETSFKECWAISGEINSQYASVIKLQNPFLSDRMKISYITDELKDKYRNDKSG